MEQSKQSESNNKNNENDEQINFKIKNINQTNDQVTNCYSNRKNSEEINISPVFRHQAKTYNSKRMKTDINLIAISNRNVSNKSNYDMLQNIDLEPSEDIPGLKLFYQMFLDNDLKEKKESKNTEIECKQSDDIGNY